MRFRDRIATARLLLTAVLGTGRSPEWPRVRAEHLRVDPVCNACGGTEQLQVHHVKPFHLHPELELDDSNLLTLCEKPAHDCHFVFGHFHNWSLFNPDVRVMVKAYRAASDAAHGNEVS